MKSILRVIADPYVHLLAAGIVLVRLSMGYDEEPRPAEDLGATPPVCEQCQTEHGWGNPCPAEEHGAEVTARTMHARVKR